MNLPNNYSVLISGKMTTLELELLRPISDGSVQRTHWPHVNRTHYYDLAGKYVIAKLYQNWNIMINHGITGKAKYIHLN